MALPFIQREIECEFSRFFQSIQAKTLEKLNEMKQMKTIPGLKKYVFETYTMYPI